MKAAEEGNLEIMKALLHAGADIEATNNKGRSVLSIAAAPSMGKPASIDAVKLLLDLGANRSHEDNDGHTALTRARRERRREVVAVFTGYRPRDIPPLDN